MIIVDNGQVKGYSAIFPGLFSKRKVIWTRDLDSGVKYAGVRILIQVVLACLAALFRHDPSITSLLSFIVIIYIFAKNIYTKRIRVDLLHESWKFSLAPLVLFFDHFTLFGMFFVVILFGNTWEASLNISTIVAGILEALAVLLGLLPVLDCFVYWKSSKETVK